MFIRRFVIFIGLLLWSQPSFADEKDTIEWAEQPEILELLPLIQQLYAHSKSSAPQTSKVLTNTEDDINIDVVSDYARLIAYVRTRPRTFSRPSFQKGREAVTLINLETYEEHYHKIPDNITMFRPNVYCTLECRKMLFENRVSSVTIGAPNQGSAIRFFKSECAPDDTQKFQWGKHDHIRSNPLKVNPVLDLCIGQETAEMPETGFYFGPASPLWPAAHSDRQVMFSDLKNINARAAKINHWSGRHPYSQEMALIFERACFVVSPALPKSALNILADATNTILDENKRWGKGYTISGTDDGFCYYPDWGAEIGKDSETNFFPKVNGLNMSLNLRRAMSSERLVEKLNNYKFDASGEEDVTQINFRRTNYIDTLIYLSSEHPDYYDEIFPHILPRIFDTSSEGLGQADDLVRLFFAAKPPIGSLSDYAEQVEALYGARLKKLNCVDWVCPNTKKAEGGLNEFNFIIIGLGHSAFPLLTRMEEAGVKNAKAIANCIGGLTSSKKAKYYKTYQDEVMIGAGVMSLDDIMLPNNRPENFTAGRFFDDVTEAKSGKSFTMTNNIGYSTNRQQVYFYDGIHRDIQAFLKTNNLMKNIQFIRRQNYDYAKALLTTEYGIEVASYLENRLAELKSQDVKLNDDVDIKFDVGYYDKTFIHGMNMNELATKRGQRQREIAIITAILEGYRRNTGTCGYQPPKPFVFFP